MVEQKFFGDKNKIKTFLRCLNLSVNDIPGFITIYMATDIEFTLRVSGHLDNGALKNHPNYLRDIKEEEDQIYYFSLPEAYKNDLEMYFHESNSSKNLDNYIHLCLDFDYRRVKGAKAASLKNGELRLIVKPDIDTTAIERKNLKSKTSDDHYQYLTFDLAKMEQAKVYQPSSAWSKLIAEVE